VKVVPLEPLKENMDGNEISWVADPIIARGTTTIEIIRKLSESITFEIGLFSHVAANREGIGRIQTKITDYRTQSFMNYAFQSQKINQETGFLEDGLEVIRDFGDKIFGTIGQDYPTYLIQNDIERLLETDVGNIELLKGCILFILQRRNKYKNDKEVGWATGEWLRESLIWYSRKRSLLKGFAFEGIIDHAIADLAERKFIYYNKYPYRGGIAYDYYISEEGTKIASAAYLPILDRLNTLKLINTDIDFLVHKTSIEIKKNYSK